MKKLILGTLLVLGTFTTTACVSIDNHSNDDHSVDDHRVDDHSTGKDSKGNVIASVDLNCTGLTEGTVTFKAVLQSTDRIGKVTSDSSNGNIVGEELSNVEKQYTYTGIIDSVTSVPTLTIYVDNVQVTDGTCK